eukprot:3326606-Rhodomonas_salina.1
MRMSITAMPRTSWMGEDGSRGCFCCAVLPVGLVVVLVVVLVYCKPAINALVCGTSGCRHRTGTGPVPIRLLLEVAVQLPKGPARYRPVTPYTFTDVVLWYCRVPKQLYPAPGCVAYPAIAKALQ